MWYVGTLYEAKWWTQGFVPNTVVINPWDTPWMVVNGVPPTTAPPTTLPPGVTLWSATLSYPAGSLVSYKAQIYRAKWWTQGFAPDTQVVNPWDTPWLLVG